MEVSLRNHTDVVRCFTQLFRIFAFGKLDVILQVSHTMYLK
jgi:hypothetical protein